MLAQAHNLVSPEKEIYLAGVQDAINYILQFIDQDGDFLYHEKENIKMFFQYDFFKNVSNKDFHYFLNHHKTIQQQKNNNQK